MSLGCSTTLLFVAAQCMICTFYFTQFQAKREASKNHIREEMIFHMKNLSLKEEQIRLLSDKITEQEQKMAKLREEMNSQTSEQLDHEDKDTERQQVDLEQQLTSLVMSTTQLQLEKKKVEEQRNQERIKFEQAKKSLEKYREQNLQ